MSFDTVLWSGIAYISGSLPWSVWLGKWFARVDPRTAADGNPGAANAFRTAGWRVGSAVLILDFLKAFLPVFVARWLLVLPEAQLFLIALAPLVGHAFSVFLCFRGGRGLTTLFGVWSGLTLHEAPMVMGITAVVATRIMKNDALSTLLLPVILGGYLLLMGKPLWMTGLVLVQLLILIVKIGPFYRVTLRQLLRSTNADSV